MNIERKAKLFIKNILKERGISYADFAKDLNISESTVKRLFTQSKLSLSNFEKMCALLGITPLQVLSADTNIRLETLSLKQEKFLCQTPYADIVFLRLMIGHSKDHIMNEVGLTERKLNTLLYKLDNHQLIRVSESGHILARKTGPFKWLKGGPLRKKYLKKVFNQSCEQLSHLVHEKTDDSHLPKAGELYLTQESYQEMQHEMNQLIEKFKKTSHFEQAVLPMDDLEAVTYVAGLDRVDLWRKITQGL